MTTEFEGVGQTPSVTEMQDMLTQKATELFMLCDKEEKGFITKRDMQRLGGELPLTPDQLEAVFDSLDDDGNGYLTLEEFTEGFGGFLGFGSEDPAEEEGHRDVYEDEQGEEDDTQEDIAFQQALEGLGATSLFDDSGRGKLGRLQPYDQQHIKELWKKIKSSEPELLGDFEDFIQKVSSDIRKARIDSDELESALRNRAYAHDEEVRKLYEEMEIQIKAEKEKILNEEKGKERKIREEMSQELLRKEQEVQELLQKQKDLETKLQEMNATQSEIATENEELAKYNESLQDKLENTSISLVEAKQYLKEIQEKALREKRERAQAALKVTEGIAQERESLVRQLDMLRDMNKKLKDDKDMHEASKQSFEIAEPGSTLQDELNEATKGESQPSPKKSMLVKQGSVMSDYITQSSPKRKANQGSLRTSLEGSQTLDSLEEIDDIEYDDDDIEVDDDAYYIERMKDNDDSGVNNNSKEEMNILHYTDDSSLGTQSKHVMRNGAATMIGGDSQSRSAESISPSSPRGEPVGCQATSTPTHNPERVFKVVFVGDSGVGKSSFIYRFCNDSFKSNFSATIGVDFQVKNVIVDHKMIALQLWDTAGQERFRSITKQYFRKADGVIVVYDVTSESSFTSVRNWMSSVQDGVEEGTVIMIIGNKTDMEDERQVKQKDGHRLSEEYETLFYEASAKSSYNVDESIQALSRKLQEKEDRELQKVLQLGQSEDKKKGCCNLD
uniref:Ras and EF-hand domain-containing protein-like n=1 Tax=Saccoglossus kowalevskii TaxID=10224 RepID=A0ABM0M1T0_SACKO|nr:PREDICTED: ras and EF-hand domain-containing protein-like [Saccoglossus kowalevskii]